MNFYPQNSLRIKPILKKFSFLLLLLFVVTILSTGCKKDKEENPFQEVFNPTLELDELGLPPATTTGENTFGCLINGEPWLPLRRNIFDNLVYNVSFTLNDGDLELLPREDYNDLTSYLQLYWNGIVEVDTFHNFNFTPGSNFVDTGDRYAGYNYNLWTESFDNKLIISRLDFEEEIISGLFQCVLIDDEINDTLFITDGRFDLKGY